MKYHWRDGGEEWSEPWGSSAAQWHGAILPRIRDCLPAQNILEIGPGFGRWTRYLRDHCHDLFIVDQSEECVHACRERFTSDPRIHSFLNDGRSLSMIADDSIDFVFSFDSLVHAKREVIEAYLREFLRTLRPRGAGFIHHSNFGEYANSVRERLPRILTRALEKAKILDWSHRRKPDLTADLFRALCAENGLRCVRQELVNWRGRRLIDCFSLFVRADLADHEATHVLRNPNFMREAARIRRKNKRANQVIPSATP